MKHKKPSRNLKETLQNIAKRKGSSFLSFIMTALLFMGTHTQVLAAAETTLNEQPVVAADQLDTSSLPQGNSTGATDAHSWTFIQELEATALGAAALGIIGGGLYKMGYSRGHGEAHAITERRNSEPKAEVARHAEEMGETAAVAHEDAGALKAVEKEDAIKEQQPAASRTWSEALLELHQNTTSKIASFGETTASFGKRALEVITLKDCFPVKEPAALSLKEKLTQVRTVQNQNAADAAKKERTWAQFGYDMATLKSCFHADDSTEMEKEAPKVAALKNKQNGQLTKNEEAMISRHDDLKAKRDAITTSSTLEEMVSAMDSSVGKTFIAIVEEGKVSEKKALQLAFWTVKENATNAQLLALKGAQAQESAQEPIQKENEDGVVNNDNAENKEAEEVVPTKEKTFCDSVWESVGEYYAGAQATEQQETARQEKYKGITG